MVSKNDEKDRNGNRSVPQGGATPKPPQGQGPDTTNRDRPMEEGRNMTNQGWPREPFTQDPVKRSTADTSRDSETRGKE